MCYTVPINIDSRTTGAGEYRSGGRRRSKLRQAMPRANLSGILDCVPTALWRAAEQCSCGTEGVTRISK
jgi:hypothetical protein